MGSRKKKKLGEGPSRMKTFYRSLNINDKIAFKAFWWHWGRLRMSLSEIWKHPVINAYGPVALQNCVSDGYTWIGSKP